MIMRATVISSIAATTIGTAVRMLPILFAVAVAAMTRMLLVLFAATATATAAAAALGGLVFVMALP